MYKHTIHEDNSTGDLQAYKPIDTSFSLGGKIFGINLAKKFEVPTVFHKKK